MPRATASEPGPADPDVILDVMFEEGLLFVAVRNIGASPAVEVSVAFEKPLMGLGGARDLRSLALFRQLAFLAPHKEIRTFLDSSAGWFARRRPAIVKAKVVFHDRSGRRFESVIRHDLRIYKDIAWVRR
jgi:hypothetical protein